MWSKQADTRNTNKNMTSFKNKITHRKRKNSKPRDPATDNADSQETDLASKSKQSEEKQRQSKSSGKNRGRNRSKKDNSKADVTNDSANKESKSSGSNCDVTISNDRDLEFADVVLRHPNNDNKRNTTNNSIKRYSDSFVIDKNDKGQIKLTEESDSVAPVLTRAVSGFFIIDQARKARRFSDLFRPGSTMKLSNSTECLKMNEKNINREKATVPDKDAKKSKPVQRTNSSAKTISKKNGKSELASPKVEQKTNANKKEAGASSGSHSYLQRVRSKIYKSKSGNAVTSSKGDEVDSASKSKKLKPKKSIEASGRIPEDEVAVLTPNGLRKSLTHFDFHLTRQTSNLERKRPQTVGPDSNGYVTSGDKPVLAKAKSSSAINLSLLRTRRNQILGKVAGKFGAKDVGNEFDFIAFGSVNNVAALGENDKLYGSQTSLQKQPSWLHIHNEEQVEVKQSQPVSRSGSDRRPDAVREEGLKHQESASGTESPHDVSLDKTEATTMASSTILPAAGSQRRVNSNINRSESVKEQSEKRKQRRNISDPSHNTTSRINNKEVMEYIHLGQIIKPNEESQTEELKKTRKLAWSSFGKLSNILKNTNNI
ncbi:hypothetical protein JTB14_007203 [Gonioctena quinquepunctata]|nr:hypothetical protein JTB14_007203 [Gonioctena quinquepunctata]